MINIYIDGVKEEALIDTGANLSVVDIKIIDQSKLSTIRNDWRIVMGPDGKRIETRGKIELNVSIDNISSSKHTFTVMNNCPQRLILGTDFLTKFDATIKCKNKEINLEVPNEFFEDPKTKKLKITCMRDIIIPPLSIMKVDAAMEEEGDFIVESSPLLFEKVGVKIPSSIISATKGKISVLVLNPNNFSQKIMKKQSIGLAEPLKTTNKIISHMDEKDLLREQRLKPADLPEQNEQIQISEKLEQSEQTQIRNLINKYKHIFSHQSQVQTTKNIKHSIITNESFPLRQKPYRVAPKERDIIEEQVEKMLEDNVIRPSSTPWASPVILVKKKDGSWRFCVDYRRLNKVTIKDVYPLPRIDDILDSLQGAKYFSALDLKSGYWQIELEEKDKSKTAFVTPDGLYEFNVMPFGLSNAPSTFERLMDNVLRGLKWKICLCYIDDVVVFSPDIETHLKRLEAIFQCFEEAGLSLNAKKCRLGFEELQLFGHTVNKDGIKPDPEKIKAIREFPKPKKLKDVRAFLGLCSYYRRFIKGFSNAAEPLNRLIKKDTPFEWKQAQD